MCPSMECIGTSTSRWPASTWRTRRSGCSETGRQGPSPLWLSSLVRSPCLLALVSRKDSHKACSCRNFRLPDVPLALRRRRVCHQRPSRHAVPAEPRRHPQSRRYSSSLTDPPFVRRVLLTFAEQDTPRSICWLSLSGRPSSATWTTTAARRCGICAGWSRRCLLPPLCSCWRRTYRCASYPARRGEW